MYSVRISASHLLPARPTTDWHGQCLRSPLLTAICSWRLTPSPSQPATLSPTSLLPSFLSHLFSIFRHTLQYPHPRHNHISNCIHSQRLKASPPIVYTIACLDIHTVDRRFSENSTGYIQAPLPFTLHLHLATKEGPPPFIGPQPPVSNNRSIILCHFPAAFRLQVSGLSSGCCSSPLALQCLYRSVTCEPAALDIDLTGRQIYTCHMRDI
jgi:hypothetical protein